jgi:hypothetical protein
VIVYRSVLAGAGRDPVAGAPGPSVSTVSGKRRLRSVEWQLGPGVSSSHAPSHQPALAEPAASADDFGAAEPQTVGRLATKSELAVAGTLVYAVISGAIVKLLKSLGRAALQGLSRVTALLSRSKGSTRPTTRFTGL